MSSAMQSLLSGNNHCGAIFSTSMNIHELSHAFIAATLVLFAH